MTTSPNPPAGGARQAAPPRERIAATILDLATARGSSKGICPSEVARALAGPDEPPDAWRRLMGPVRAEAVALARAGRLQILRKGKPAGLEELRGVIRLRIPPDEPGAR
ncbi:DUF3253 domain-containing protein [Roseomonas sp. OT10]|uniref:DUF3253 domain-containing protein n=1 Tax=Roseomonas cutis TaxID=2897332 RepID=UPI001E5D628A|nr:DUF3253 domain-containing protein [Roseomonas sp. OT10]UFN51054.1 DUF3253 domain-containing protein [Roseomonas sp. OT10]